MADAEEARSGRRACPSCGSDRVHRSQRRGWELLLTPLPLRAFRCHECHHRFLALSGWKTERLREARCPSCGMTDLMRTSGRHVHGGALRALWRSLRVPAYHCDACRLSFFDLTWAFHRRWARGVASSGQENGTSSAHGKV